MTNSNGFFLISLDFESMWGSIGSKDYNGFVERTKYEREIIAGILERFKKHQIHSTWGIVGAMACHSKEEAIKLNPNNIHYPEWNVDTHQIIDNATSEYFLSDLVLNVSTLPYTEIASHTFTHVYFKNPCVTEEDATKELELSKKVLSNYGDVNTVIFPRNQIDDCKIRLLNECGYNIYRGTITRLFRNNKYFEFLNCYLPISKKTSYPISTIKAIEGVYNIPASMFLRFYNKKLKVFEKLKLNRIKREMKRSAEKHLVFHLWFHPHNLGTNLEKNFAILDNLLNYFDFLKSKYDYKSVNINELKTLLQTKEIINETL